MSKVYLAGKVGLEVADLIDFANELESAGHNILLKWWEQSLNKPYLDYEISKTAAFSMYRAAYDSDVTILIPASDILGAAVEFGVSLASKESNQNKIIIVVNPYATRQSVFYAHPYVIVVKDLSEIRNMEWF